MYPPPVATTDYDHQDLVNQLLAAVLLTRATLDQVRRAAALSPADQPQAAADFTDAATALTRIHDTLLRTADTVGEAGTQHPQTQSRHRTTPNGQAPDSPRSHDRGHLNDVCDMP